MSKKLSLALSVAFALSALGGVARASNPVGSDQINALEAGNPHSIDYPNREILQGSPTNEQINALETGNPHSVDYANRERPRRSTNEEIYAGETGDPNSVDNKSGRSASQDSHRPVLESAGGGKP